MKKIMLPFLLIALSPNLTLLAQQQNIDANTDVARLKELSEQQKEILIEQRELIKKLHTEFKSTLTEQQKALLKNDSMDIHKRKEAFVNSLNEDQKTIYRLIRKGVHQSRGNFHKSLSKEQKKKLGRHKKHKKSHENKS